MNTYTVAFNGKTTMYEVHADGCKHLMARHLDVCSMGYIGPDGAWVKNAFEAQNEGCLAKLGPCAKKGA